MSATANREDTFGSRQRGEETSRLETRLESEFESSAMEGLHAEDCPQLVKSIQAAQKMGQDDEAAAEDVRKEYLAATADGSVRRLQGDPDVKAILPEAGDNEWDRLKKKRLADMKQRAAQRHVPNRAQRPLNGEHHVEVKAQAHPQAAASARRDPFDGLNHRA